MLRKLVLADVDEKMASGELDDPVQQALVQSLYDFMDRDDDSPCHPIANKTAENLTSVNRNRCYSFFFQSHDKEPGVNKVPAKVTSNRHVCYSWLQRQKPVQANQKADRSLCASFLRAPETHDESTSRNKPK